MLCLFENSPDVLEFFSVNPFSDHPPTYLRARLYAYEFAPVSEILESGKWWHRDLVGEYMPAVKKP